MIDVTRISHFAIAVPDVEAAIDEFASAYGLEFAELTDVASRVEIGGEIVEIPLRVTYSVQGPPHLELIEGPDDTIWEAAPGIHHVGVWSDDLAGQASDLAASGMEVELAGASRSGRTPYGYTYHRSASGYRVELVDSASRPLFEEWFAGGSFPG